MYLALSVAVAAAIQHNPNGSRWKHSQKGETSGVLQGDYTCPLLCAGHTVVGTVTGPGGELLKPAPTVDIIGTSTNRPHSQVLEWWFRHPSAWILPCGSLKRSHIFGTF